MKPKFIPLILSFLLASCGGGSSSAVSSASSVAPAAFSYPELEEGEARLQVFSREAHLWWNAPDYDGYRVYGCASKYGNYELLSGEKLLQTESFHTSKRRYGYFMVVGVNDGEETIIGDLSAFGEQALVIAPGDDLDAVQWEIDERHGRLESGSTGQFSSERFAMLLYPGDYPNLSAKLGYYSSCYGLGEVPTETRLGELYVSTNVLGNNNATCTFWRNAENLTLPNATQFAVSQATSLRRCYFEQNLALSHPSGWSSGGFLADCKVDGRVEPRTQQQWISRNDEIAVWSGSGHNYVFVGCEGNLPAHAWSEQTSRTSIIEKTPRVAEMPFLYADGDDYFVFLPNVRQESSGISWKEDIGAGTSISLDQYYLAHAEYDDDESLNAALSTHKGIVFTPGIYSLHKPLHVERENTLLLGLGYATLEVADDNREGAVLVEDVGGFRLAGLLLDAGRQSSYLLKLGTEKTDRSHHDNPSILSDLFCRLGGKENRHTEVETMVILNQNDVLGDNFWLWRADHSSGVAWQDYEDRRETIYGNPGSTGLLVEGDDVIVYGLMVEHFEKYQTIWNGENGSTYMYQSEVPYAVPSQQDWMSHDGQVEGYASYKVGDQVQNHYAIGLGVYWVHYTYDFLASAIETPLGHGVRLDHLVTTTFSGYESGGIRHVINDVGEAVGEGGLFRSLVDTYPIMEEES